MHAVSVRSTQLKSGALIRQSAARSVGNHIPRTFRLRPTHFQTTARVVGECGPRSSKLPPTQFQSAARAPLRCGPLTWKLRPVHFQSAARAPSTHLLTAVAPPPTHYNCSSNCVESNCVEKARQSKG